MMKKLDIKDEAEDNEEEEDINDNLSEYNFSQPIGSKKLNK